MSKTKNSPKWHSEKRKLSDLKPNPKNPRVIDTDSKEFKDAETSVTKFGLAEPIVINKDGTIIGGHARKLIEERREVKETECWIPDRQLTDEEVDELTIRLNKNIAGRWDTDKLLSFDRDFLVDCGFTTEELDLGYDILSGDEAPQTKDHSGVDKIGELVKFETMMRPDERDVLIKAVNHIKEHHPSHTTLADCLVFLATKYNKSLEEQK